MMLPHRDKWDAHYSTIDETVYIGRDVFVVVASTLSLYNAIELLTLISLTFKRRSGLYFWSILIASFGIIPYCLGWLIVYFDLTHDYVGMIIETVGWVLVISGQSFVLYSRLHLIVTDVKILRAVLIMIIINGLVWHSTMTVLLFGSEYSPSDNRRGFNNVFNIAEKISMSIFYLQELIISGLYIWKSMEILKTAFGNTRSMLYKLFTINFVIILMDIALLAIEFHDLYVWEQGIKLVTYSIKLKLEFAVLSELIEFVRTRSGTRSRPTKNSENQSTFVPLSSMHKGNTKGTTSSTRDFIHAGDSRTNTTIAATNPIPPVPTNDSIHVLREVDVETMQLVQTARAVKEYIAAYKSAAKELESLADKLDDIETICCSLEVILSDGTRSFNTLEVNLLQKLRRIIQQCLSKVSDIHKILNSISRMQKNTRNPLKTVGALFLRYKDQIRLATNGLDRCLSSLQLHMTANILTVTMTSHKAVRSPLPTTTTSTAREAKRIPGVRKLDLCDKRPTRRKSPETIIDTWRQAWSTKAFVQWTRRTTKEEISSGSSSSAIQDDSIFTIGSSLLSLYVKVSLRRGNLAPFCITLQIPRVIYLQEGQRQIGEKVEMAFMDDNLGQIQAFFTQGILTPATVIAWDEYDPDNETSLLGLAALTKSQSILRFLATQTFDLSNRNHIGSARYLYAFNGEDGPRCVLEYIKIRQDSILASEFHMILRGLVDPYNAQICIEACKPHFSGNMVVFNTAVWRYAMKQFKHDLAVNIEGWADLIAGCISRGLDIHQQLRSDTEFSALKDILFYNWDTDEILEHVHRWIHILEEAGVNIKEYLMVETECCFATWRDTPYWNNKKTGSSNYRRVLFIEESRGRQFPFWALFIQDECPVKELLTEHEHFASPLTLYQGGSTQAYIAQHEAWKEHQTLGVPGGSDRHRKGWPFWLPLRHYNDYSAEEAEWVDRELQLAQDRQKRHALDAMDRVYSLSDHPVALLGRPIQDEDEMRTLSSILKGALVKYHEGGFALSKGAEYNQARKMLCLIYEITRDKWWTRAWTFQENYRAGLKMTLLIHHSADFEDTKRSILSGKKPMFGVVPGELSVQSARFSESATKFCLGFRRHHFLTSEDEEMIDHILATAGKYTILLSPSSSMSGTIVSDVRKRGVTEPWDCLAIIANCCQYATRLNSTRLQDSGVNLDLAILALRLVNGEVLKNDEPLVSEHEPMVEQINNLFFDDFRAPEGARRLTFNKSCRFVDVNFTKTGIVTRGHLWKLDDTLRAPRSSPRLSQPSQKGDQQLSEYDCTRLRQLVELVKAKKGRKDAEIVEDMKDFLEEDAFVVDEDESFSLRYRRLMAKEVVRAMDADQPLTLGYLCDPSGEVTTARAIFIRNRNLDESEELFSQQEDDLTHVFTSLWSEDQPDEEYLANDLDHHVSLGVRISVDEYNGLLRLYTKEWVLGLCFFVGAPTYEVIFPWPPPLSR
ncbi:hypothetical protein ACKLNR_013624 [Fusarium oxysporum f. sp. zingiberi]